jgi:alkylhydroperoxidase/carboxymuconolactone decarboxylase family protein YurZ
VSALRTTYWLISFQPRTIGYGATPQEILEVMEIASVLGIHAVTSAAPILAELASEHSEEAL